AKKSGRLLATADDLLAGFENQVFRRDAEASADQAGDSSRVTKVKGGELLRRSLGSLAESREVLARAFGTCIGRVEARGLIRRLNFGDLVLLQPELLDAYASAMINVAKDEPDGLGSLAEDEAREGRFRMSSDERIADK